MNNQNNQKKLVKGFDPIYDENSEVLILGTAPGVESLKKGEYYADPGNRFWEMIEAVYGSNGTPLKSAVYQEKIKYLLDNKIALWDILAFCYRNGSLDKSIYIPCCPCCDNNETLPIKQFIKDAKRNKIVFPDSIFNDIEGLVKKTKIKKIICAGSTAYDLFQIYLKSHPLPGVVVEYAPSTSSMNNGHYAGDKLINAWKAVL